MRTSFVLLFSVLTVFSLKLRAAEKNVIFYIADDLGHYLGCYGYSKIKTPHMDALAADGTLFTRAYATTASCSASRSVIMTGLHNHANGQYGHAHDAHYPASWPVLDTVQHSLESTMWPRKKFTTMSNI
jgi:N-sulfoglucosamine sulfohydrolase